MNRFAAAELQTCGAFTLEADRNVNVAHWRLWAHYANEGVIGQSYSPSEFREHRRLRSAYICIAAAAAVIKEIRQGHNLASLTQFIQLDLLCFAQIKKKNKNHSSVETIRQNSQGSLEAPQRRTGPTDSSAALDCLTEFEPRCSSSSSSKNNTMRLSQ